MMRCETESGLVQLVVIIFLIFVVMEQTEDWATGQGARAGVDTALAGGPGVNRSIFPD